MNSNLIDTLIVLASVIVILHGLYYIRLVLKLGNVANAGSILRSALTWSVVMCGYVAMAFYTFIGV